MINGKTQQDVEEQGGEDGDNLVAGRPAVLFRCGQTILEHKISA
jgi:hypothetical protein